MKATHRAILTVGAESSEKQQAFNFLQASFQKKSAVLLLVLCACVWFVIVFVILIMLVFVAPRSFFLDLRRFFLWAYAVYNASAPLVPHARVCILDELFRRRGRGVPLLKRSP